MQRLQTICYLNSAVKSGFENKHMYFVNHDYFSNFVSNFISASGSRYDIIHYIWARSETWIVPLKEIYTSISTLLKS